MCVLIWYCLDATAVLVQFRKYARNRTFWQRNCIRSEHFWLCSVRDCVQVTKETSRMREQCTRHSLRFFKRPGMRQARGQLRFRLCVLVLFPDQWSLYLTWERDYMCACVQNQEMASFVTNSNHRVLWTAFIDKGEFEAMRF